MNKIKSFFKDVSIVYCLIALFSSAILAFGLYNIHFVSNITEGGILGLVLLFEHWFNISPSVSGLVLNLLCYGLGWKLFGRNFIIYSLISSFGFSIFYVCFEQFPPLFPSIANMPLIASVVGAMFVGISAGICVRIGGAPSGDDALAMSISKLTHMKIQWAYMICDIVVLGMSLTYIPISKIVYSFITVIISGQIIGIIQNMKKVFTC